MHLDFHVTARFVFEVVITCHSNVSNKVQTTKDNANLENCKWAG